MAEWKPLRDIWMKYNLDIYQKMASQDPDELEAFWPDNLYIGEVEREDIEKFVHERTHDIVQAIQAYGGVHPMMIASYILRSVVSGMMWENERLG